MDEFKKALAFVLEFEGGYTDDPHDHGGRTNFGITESEYNRWLAARDKKEHVHTPVMAISRREVESIYRSDYWFAARCDQLQAPAAIALFDSVVNCGIRQGVKFLQRAVGVVDDGVFGPKTLAAAQAADPRRLCRAIGDQRLKFYTQLVDQDHSQMRFLRGWNRRANALKALGA